jgi:hypothetical protein
MWIQCRGVPPHFDREVKKFFNDNYHGRQLGRGKPVPWPPRLPILSPLDFFLWGCLKFRVYHNDKTETWLQLVQATNEAAVGNRNKLKHM